MVRVSAACLTKMKQLASIRGIGVAARKFHPSHVPQALSTEDASHRPITAALSKSP